MDIGKEHRHFTPLRDHAETAQTPHGSLDHPRREVWLKSLFDESALPFLKPTATGNDRAGKADGGEHEINDKFQPQAGESLQKSDICMIGARLRWCHGVVKLVILQSVNTHQKP
jgi:hypothetical protein